jgi:phosphocarrier protein
MEDLACTLHIVNPLGLHARAAARLAAIAQEAVGAVWIQSQAGRADAASIIDVLTLACPQGSRVTLKIDNPADRPILERMVRMVQNGFGEMPGDGHE